MPQEDHCNCNCSSRTARAKSIATVAPTVPCRNRSPTPYDNDLAPSALMPESTSYDEALKDVAMASVHQEEEENANEIDLTSSMDSRRSRADDADVESEDDEGNGNILNTSMDSRSSKSEDEVLRYRIDTSQSTMMSSLERSLELGAARSDGLSDNERRVQAVKNSIKTHRRSHSVSASGYLTHFRSLDAFLDH